MNRNVLVAVIIVAVVAAGVAIYLGMPSGGGKAAGGGQTENVPGGGQQGGQSSGPEAPVQCADPSCLMPRFGGCKPTALSMPFIGNTTYNITIVGLEGGKCHFKLSLPMGGVQDCLMPTESMTVETLGHLFGSDKAPGQEAVLQRQETLYNESCTIV